MNRLRGFVFSFAILLAVTPFSAHGGIAFDPLVYTGINSAVLDEGYLDVTKPPYNVDNTGDITKQSSNTTQIQAAIDHAYAHNLAVFFPAGTYDVDDQLHVFQRTHKAPPNAKHEELTNCHVLVGSSAGSRPVIRLQGNNFDDAGNHRSVFYYFASKLGNGIGPNLSQSGYNMVFRGIDIDLNGKAGAVGIRMQAAQGSAIQDVKIIATNAFAGIESLCDSGATHANIHIEGGQYGFYVTENKPMPVISGITCIGQTVRAIHFPTAFRGCLTVVGFHIEAANGPVFDLDSSCDDEHISLIDGVIKITDGSVNNVVIKNTNRSVYMRNVYVENGHIIVDNLASGGTKNIVNPSQSGWTHFGDYNYFHLADRQLIGGSLRAGEHSRDVTIGTASPPPNDLVSRHLWDESTFPHFEDPDIIIIGPSADDTWTINQAIADAKDAGHNKVFLKKGDYYLTGSINLEKDTKLVGVSRNLSRIRCDSSWSVDSGYVQMVTTPVNGANATCTLAWLALQMPFNSIKRITFVDWTAGRHSMVREVNFMKEANWGGAQLPLKRIQISGSGGGRWYGLYAREAQEQGEDDNHRMLYVTGTEEPLSFYSFCVEYQESEVYMTEVNDSSNVSFFGFKLETDLNTHDDPMLKHTPALGIVNSDHVIVMGSGGSGELDQDESNRGLFEVAGNSSNILIANATGGWGLHTGFGIVMDVRDMNTPIGILKNDTDQWSGAGDPVALYSIGYANPLPYVPLPTQNNLLSNGDFENDLTDWIVSNPGQTSVNTTDPYSGSKATQINCNNSTIFLDWVVDNITVGTEYTVSARIKIENAVYGSGDNVKFKADFLKANGVDELEWNTIETSNSNTNGYELFSLTATASNSLSAKLRIRINAAGVNSGTIKIDAVSVTDGSAPPPPPPGDLLTNGDFESDLNDWIVSNPGQTSVNTTDPYSGSKAAQINCNNSTIFIDQMVDNITIGTEYTVSARIKIENAVYGSGDNVKFKADFLKANGVDELEWNTIETSNSNTNGYELFSLTATASNSLSAKLRIRINAAGVNSGTIKIDTVSVTSGSAPPPANIYENDGTDSDPSVDFTHINGSHMDEYSYTNGKLECSASWDPWRRIQLTAAGAASWTDYSVDIDIENIENGTNKNIAALLLRCAGGENYYIVLVDSNNNLFVGKRTTNPTEPTWAWSNGVACGANSSAYSLSVDVSGSSTTNIDVYVNGSSTAAINYSDSTNPHTVGGMGVEARGNNCAFDNIVVY